MNFSFLKKINFENFDKGMVVFNKGMKDFGRMMDSMNAELKMDFEKADNKAIERERINKENLDKIWGTKNINTIFFSKL
ncbi:MAG: hypothetical protein IIC67_00625 [Thaumarchaeota archaeon]|nr:hypothetical protein [Nitrososphaerota archaeon]